MTPIHADKAKQSFYWIGFTMSAALFGIANYFNFTRPVTCADCFFPFGWPFRFYQLGGFAGGKGMVWVGLAADVFFMLAAAVIFSRILQWALGKTSAHDS